MPDHELATHEWWEQFKDTVNSDPEMKVRGHDRFSENFSIDIGDERFLIKMHGGTVSDIIPNPGPNEEWSFGVEGTVEAWEEFVRENPPAFNNEIIASNYRTVVRGDDGHLQMTGNNKKIFQNLRPFQRSLDLMRVAHNTTGA